MQSTVAGSAIPAPVGRSLAQTDGLALMLRSSLERIDLVLARAAAGFVRDRTWVAFGFARVDDHARERFGRSGRWVRDCAALGEAVARLPGLAAALAGDDGAPPLGRVATLLVARAASPASLSAWVARARALSVRDLRAAVKQARIAGSDWPSGGDPQEAQAGTGAAPAEDDSAAPAPGHAVGAVEDDISDRSQVRIPVPAPLLAAFDEAVDLYRAVEGTEASVTSFVEALVAESLAGDWLRDEDESSPRADSRPGDIDRVSVEHGAHIASIEDSLARSTSNWGDLPREPSASWALALAGPDLARLHEISRSAGTGTPADLDAQMRSLIALENGLEGRLGRVLAAMAERGVWSRLHFAGIGHYAEERLGLSRTSAEDRARAARSLRDFPLLCTAYEDGRVGLEATLLVLRILGPGPVDPETEAAWLARAEEATVKRLRDEVRALGRRRFADRPGIIDLGGFGDPCGAELPGDLAISLAVGGRGRPAWVLGPGVSVSRAPRPLKDAEWHASLRRDAGVACRRVLRYGRLAGLWSDGTGCLPVPDVFLRLRLPDDLADSLLTLIESARLALTDEIERCPWGDPRSRLDALPSTLAARTFSSRDRRVPAWVGLLALLEDFVLIWDGAGRPDGHSQPVFSGARRMPRRRGDAVYIRDGWRCSAPACTSRRNLEDHHIIYRSQQGCDDAFNRICLCQFHHRQGEHGLLASCRGTAPLGVRWRLGASQVGAFYLNERRQLRRAAARGGSRTAIGRGA